MTRVDIHQIQIKYEPVPDRLLMQVRTRQGELFAVWLTRRMISRVWLPFQKMASTLAVARTAPGAIMVPEARAMMAEVARHRVLPNADFKTAFAQEPPVATPLGPEPLLATTIDLNPQASGGMVMNIHESGGRSMALRLTEELGIALMRLFEQALQAADWGLAPPPAAAEAQSEAKDTPPPLMN